MVGHVRGLAVSEPLEARDQTVVEDRDLPVEDQGRDLERPDGGHDVRVAPGVVTPLPADQLHGGAVLVGHHAVTIHLLFVDQALTVEGPADQRGLHQGDRGETGRRHGPSISTGTRLLDGSRRGQSWRRWCAVRGPVLDPHDSQSPYSRPANPGARDSWEYEYLRVSRTWGFWYERLAASRYPSRVALGH